ncbi:MAG: hypothetical protein K8S97_07570 [Anaerolineae bacterium]|nr:hypothetical protein [Anaerolineae bacterium]
MAQEQMERARALIKAKRYAEARAILMGIDHPTAQQWLAKLDELDSPFAEEPSSKGRRGRRQQREPSERRGPSCLGIGLGIGCVAPALFCGGVLVILLIIAVLINAGQDKAQKDALEANNGRGTLDEPIAAGTWMQFDDGEVRATQLIRPADATIEGFHSGNRDAADGAEYVLVWFDVRCNQAKCNEILHTGFRLVDTDGKEWDEEIIFVLSENLNGQEAIEGGMMAGWQVFEIAQGNAIQAVKVTFEGVSLYCDPPQ